MLLMISKIMIYIRLYDIYKVYTFFSDTYEAF